MNDIKPHLRRGKKDGITPRILRLDQNGAKPMKEHSCGSQRLELSVVTKTGKL
jgi:hypothetical protein